MALELKGIVETNLVRLSYHFTSHCFQFYSYLKQLYTSNKMECFSYRGDCGVCGRHMRIETFREELPWATDKQLWI